MSAVVHSARDRDRGRATKPRVAAGATAHRTNSADAQRLATGAKASRRHLGSLYRTLSCFAPDVVHRNRDQAHLAGTSVLPAGTGGEGRPSVPHDQVSNDAKWC